MIRRISWIFLCLAGFGLFLFASAVPHWGAAQAASAQHGHVYVEPGLLDQLKARGQVDLFVYLKERPDLSPAHAMSWEERGHFVHDTLRSVAERSQAPILRELHALGADTRTFWIENVIAVRQGTMPMVDALLGRNDIAAIISEPVGFIPEPDGAIDDDNQINAPISSILQIKAPDVWAMGFTGQGITVGIIDSGTRYTHQALVNQYRGNLGGGSFDHNYNWFDIAGSTAPTWPNPHGTHVTGTAIGDDGGSNQIGVAPGAEWVSCLGCTSTSCPGANLLACAEFMAAPTDLAGNNPDPDRRAHVVNNSWGDCGQSYSGWYQGVVDAWIAAGIVPIFANGNAGNCGYSSPPGLNTVGNPARYGSVLGIGSSGNSNGQYANHSNWGPTDNPNDGSNPALPDPMGFFDLKPNVIAPGVSIFSSTSTSDSSYGSAGWTGTSMSAPAAAGLVALMWSAAPGLIGDYATTGTLIMQTANPIPYDSGGPNPGPGNVPNYASGWGEIDALAAVEAAIAASGPQGTISGLITDGNGFPVPGAQISIENPDPPPAGWMATTGENGLYSIGLGVGTYDVEVMAYGYQAVTVTDVEVLEGEVTTVNVQLASAGSHTVSGTVSDSLTDWPLHARIDIAGYPNSPVYTDPADGSYSVNLAGDFEFTFTVTALSGGYDFEARTVGPLNAAAVEDFALDADLAACSAPGYDAGNLFEENFEANDGGFVSSGVANNWQWGSPTVWPNECAEGSNCWGTNMSGNYNNSANAQVISPVIDLSAASGGLTLTWQQANHIESAQWDQGYAEYRVDGGPWQIMWEHTGTTSQVGWRELSHDISDAAGGDLELRWRIVSDSIINFPGIYFDAIAIRGEDDCEPMAGELVSGRVTDGNTGAGLNGVPVTVDGAGFATTTATSEDPAMGSGAYRLFVPEGSQTLSVTHPGYQPADFSDSFVDGQARRVDFALQAGRVHATPESLSKTLEFGTTAEGFLILVNDGGADANVSLSVVAGIEEDFEGDFPPAGWEVVNNGGDCVWARNDQVNRPNHAGGDGFSAAADSDRCGSGTTMNTSLISPLFAVAGGTALDFVVSYRHLGSSRLDIEITTDGSSWDLLQRFDASVSPEGPGTPVSIPLGAYDGAQNAQVRFTYVAPGWDWWAQVDQIEISGEADWLSVTPDAGTFDDGGNLPMFETLNVTVNYDAGAPSVTEPGTYSARILVETDTPYGHIDIPVQMHVTPAANQARLTGQVNSLGYCDDNPSPAAGASVAITGQTDSYSLSTDANGQYSIWLDVGDAPLAIEVSAAGHVSQLIAGVPLSGGGTTVRNFDLRLDEACANATPTDLSATLLPGESEDFAITLSNSGAAELNWTTDTGVPATVISGGSRPSFGVPSGVGRNGALDLLGLTQGEVSPAGGFAPLGAFDCDDAPGLVIHDDGSIENGYSGNPDVVSQVAFLEYYEPAQYPAVIGTVCIAFVSLGPSELNYELVVFAADGAGGTPGTQLAAVPAQATGIPGGGLPPSPPWYTVDLSGLNLLVESGGVYVGARYAPVPGGVFVASDESSSTPQQAGFWQVDGGTWDPIQGAFANYRALFVRPQMDVAGGCSQPESVPWLDVSPAAGTTAAGASSLIDVAINAGGLVPGEYEATVCIYSDDPQRGTIGVPVSLTVDAPEDFARISGIVMSLGYCDANPDAASGAMVEISGALGSYTTFADGTGMYQVMLDPDESPIDVTVSAAGHEPQTQTGVVFGPADEVELDFDLRALLGCTSVEDGALTAFLDSGESETFTIGLDNSGLADASFSVDSVDTTVMVEVLLDRPGHAGTQTISLPGARVTSAGPRAGDSRLLRISPRGSVFSVGVVSPDSDVSDLVGALAAFPEIDAERYTGDLATITGADLAGYDVVVISNNTQWAAAGADVSVGNALADYVDAGGRVVVNHFAHDWDAWSLSGRFITDGYSPFTGTSSDFSGNVSLGTVHLPDHPVMDGVVAVTNSYLWQNPALAADADRIADWSDGNVLVAANEEVVAFNILPSDGNGIPGWTGDLDVMYFNAVNYLMGGGAGPAEWLSFDPETGLVEAGEGASIEVTFTALIELEPGIYTATIRVSVDDGQGANLVEIPATMYLGIDDPDTIFHDRFEQLPNG